METNPRDIDCAALRPERGPAKLFAFPSARNSRSGLTPPPTVYNILSMIAKKR